MKTPREILENMECDSTYGEPFVRCEAIDQALAEIDAHYKSKVPKKLKGHTFTTMKYIPEDSVIWTGYRQGYNQCVDDFHKEAL